MQFASKITRAQGTGLFSSHYTSLKFTEFNYDSHYSSKGRSLQYDVFELSKQCGWLIHSAFVQSWSTHPAVSCIFIFLGSCELVLTGGLQG